MNNTQREHSANDMTQIVRKGRIEDVPPMPGWGELCAGQARMVAVPIIRTKQAHRSSPKHGYRKCYACDTQRPLAELKQLGASKDYVFCIGTCADERQAKIDKRGW
jgi:hypothetical protein